jgi:hypothetical protein
MDRWGCPPDPITLSIVDPLWTSLSAREGASAFALRQAVPPGLEGELREWIYGAVSRLPDRGRRLMIRLNLVVPASYEEEHAREWAAYHRKVKERQRRIEAARAAQEDQGQSSATSVTPYPFAASTYPSPPTPLGPQIKFLAYGTSTDLLLDVIDGVLDLLPYKQPPPPTTDLVVLLVRRARKAVQSKDQRGSLQRLLDDGQMIYRVRADGHGLERRADPVANALAITAADAADLAGYSAAGARLRNAWNSIYSLKPDPSAAYRDAIRAVEAVANPFFLPEAPAPTLGQVIRHLEYHGDRYAMVVAAKTGQAADVKAVLGMMRLLWEGHRDRHEGGPTTGPITPASAEAALSLAVTLVQLIVSGSIELVE